MGQRSTAETLAWYASNRTSAALGFDPDGMCLKVVRVARGIGPKYASAKDAQDATPSAYRVTRLNDIKPGMVMFFDTVGDSNPFGHIVTVDARPARVYSLADLTVWTNSVKANQLVKVRGDYFQRYWADRFTFAATWLNGEPIESFVPQPKPLPEPSVAEIWAYPLADTPARDVLRRTYTATLEGAPVTTAREVWTYALTKPAGYGGTGATAPTGDILRWTYRNAALAASRGADWTKHAGVGPYSFPPNTICDVDPEGKGGIRPAITGPAVLSVAVKLALPPVGERPTRVRLWARRFAEGKPANATTPGDFAVPLDTDPEFRVVWTYQTFIEKAKEPVTFHLQHNARTTLAADLAQIVVTVHPVAA